MEERWFYNRLSWANEKRHLASLRDLAFDSQIGSHLLPTRSPGSKGRHEKSAQSILAGLRSCDGGILCQIVSATIHTTGSVTGQAVLTQVGFTETANLN
jgi:hypothetical protein